MNAGRTRALAACSWLLLAPAAAFLLAVAAQAHAPAARHFVLLYAGRGWTLWVLMISLPLLSVASALAGLRAAGRDSRVSLGASAGVGLGILAVVALHMAAN